MARRFGKVSEEEIKTAFFYPSDLVNTKTTIPLRVGGYIYPPLFTSPSGDSCIIYTYVWSVCVLKSWFLLLETQAGKSHLMWAGKRSSQSDKEINCPEGPITWWISAHSPYSERNSIKMKVAITWRRFQPGLKILARFQKPDKDFQLVMKPWNPGWKSMQIDCDFASQ